MSEASTIIARLELKPHPEGGYYRETFRDARADAQGRAVLFYSYLFGQSLLDAQVMPVATRDAAIHALIAAP